MKDLITLSTLHSPLGNLTCGVFQEQLILLEFDHEERLSNQLKQLEKHLSTRHTQAKSALAQEVQKQLTEYFNKSRQNFDLPLLLTGSAFQTNVWNSLKDIPYGRTVTYQQQALNYGDIKAIRAVAKANGENKIGIVLPCHRVIGSDGSLTGYAGELWRKKALLELEGAMARQGSLF